MEFIDRVGKDVINKMMNIPELKDFQVDELEKITLGKLRKNNRTMMGCCRFKKNSRWVRKNSRGEIIARGKDFWPYANTLGPSDVRRIDLHPDLLQHKWERLARSVLYHEYLHALGFRHCSTFRKLESLWPDKEAVLGTRLVKLKSPMYNSWTNRLLEN